MWWKRNFILMTIIDAINIILVLIPIKVNVLVLDDPEIIAANLYINYFYTYIHIRVVIIIITISWSYPSLHFLQTHFTWSVFNTSDPLIADWSGWDRGSERGVSDDPSLPPTDGHPHGQPHPRGTRGGVTCPGVPALPRVPPWTHISKVQHERVQG